jgi:Alanine-zipper, major outer membrane lipoprotein
MMKVKLIVVALAVTALSSGCMCFQGNCSRGGGGGASYSSGGGGGSIAEGDLMRIEEAANRAEAAANRAEAAADRASLAAEKAETLFHKGLRK